MIAVRQEMMGFFLFFFLMSTSLLMAPPQWLSTKVVVTVHESGNATVHEEINIYLSGNETLEKYEMGMNALEKTVTEWRALLLIDDIRFHTTDVSPINVRVIPSKLMNCDVLRETCEAKIVIDYETARPLFNKTMVKPRTYAYSLRNGTFLFETAKSGEIVIPRQTSLTIILPPTARVNKIIPPPDVVGTERKHEYTWIGKTNLPNFEITFEIIEPMEKEVGDYFTNLSHTFRERWIEIGVGGVIFLALATIYFVIQERVSKK